MNWLHKLFNGELISVKIIKTGDDVNGWCVNHTLVELEDGRRMCINGHLGEPGEVIKVYSKRLWNPR